MVREGRVGRWLIVDDLHSIKSGFPPHELHPHMLRHIVQRHLVNPRILILEMLQRQQQILKRQGFCRQSPLGISRCLMLGKHPEFTVFWSHPVHWVEPSHEQALGLLLGSVRQTISDEGSHGSLYHPAYPQIQRS